MRSSIRRLLLLVAWPVAAAAAPAPVPEGRPVLAALPPELQELVTAWLWQDCSVGDPARRLAERMASAGSALEDALWEAFDLGPTLEARELLQSSLGSQWLLRHRWLEERGAEAIGAEATQQLLAESEEEFRNEEDVKQVARWRDAALAGLGRVCTSRSVERLLLLAERAEEQPGPAARAALKASDYCNRPS